MAKEWRDIGGVRPAAENSSAPVAFGIVQNLLEERERMRNQVGRIATTWRKRNDDTPQAFVIRHSGFVISAFGI